MSLTVNTSASETKMTTLTRIKSELGTTSTSDDAYLTNLIKEASDQIRSYCNRKFEQETVTEKLPSRSGPTLTVERTPVTSISYVKLDGSTVSSTSYVIDDADAGILFKEDGWDETILFESYISKRPTRHGYRDWEIKYTAGYVHPSTSTGSTGTRNLPYDLERACVETVKSLYYTRTVNPNIKRQEVGDASETYFDTLNTEGISKSAVNLLRPWRRIEF